MKTDKQKFLDFKKTKEKEIKKGNYYVACARCKWNKGPCDIHHKIPKKDGGTSNKKNLIYLCPNCHRIEHMVMNKRNENSLEQIKRFYQLKQNEN